VKKIINFKYYIFQMQTKKVRTLFILGALSSSLLTACGGGGSSAGSTGTPSTYTLGGSISGLVASGLVLSDGTQTAAIPANASSWTFTNSRASGASYNVTVQTQPTGERCTVTSGTGTLSAASVSSVAVACFAAGVVSTVAGPNPATSGYVDGVGSSAKFNFPAAIAVAASGNIYVADWYNNVVRKILPNGTVSTFAGTGLHGANNGAGTLATFNGINGLAVDAAENVYVADGGNNMIRKIDSTGFVSTLAGSLYPAEADGLGTAASFTDPWGITLDASANVYVSEYFNGVIRKITPSGNVTTIAGSTNGYVDGAKGAAKFANPKGLVVSSAGIIYVADEANEVIRAIDAQGNVTTLAGLPNRIGYADGNTTSALFHLPNAIALDTQNNLIVSDSLNNAVRKVTLAGVVTTMIRATPDGAGGTLGFVDGTLANAKLGFPDGLAIDTAGNIFLAERTNLAIRKIIP